MSSSSLCESFKLDDTNVNNWNIYANSIVQAFGRLSRPAAWNAQQSSAIHTNCVGTGSNGAVNKDLVSCRIDTVFQDVIKSAENVDGFNQAYIASVKHFLTGNGQESFDPDNGWLNKPSDVDDDWLIASEYVKYNRGSEYSDARTITLNKSFLSKKNFLFLGKIGTSQNVYAVEYVRNQYVDGDIKLRRDGSAADSDVGIFGNVIIAPSVDFNIDLVKDLNWTPKKEAYLIPLLDIPNAAFQAAVGRFISVYIALRFLQSQKLEDMTSFYNGAPVAVTSQEIPSIGRFYITRDSRSMYESLRGGNPTKVMRLKLVDEVFTRGGGASGGTQSVSQAVIARYSALPTSASGTAESPEASAGTSGALVNISGSTGTNALAIAAIVMSVMVCVFGMAVAAFLVYRMVVTSGVKKTSILPSPGTPKLVAGRPNVRIA